LMNPMIVRWMIISCWFLLGGGFLGFCHGVSFRGAIEQSSPTIYLISIDIGIQILISKFKCLRKYFYDSNWETKNILG
jgi:hypothetical protein